MTSNQNCQNLEILLDSMVMNFIDYTPFNYNCSKWGYNIPTVNHGILDHCGLGILDPWILDSFHRNNRCATVTPLMLEDLW